MCILRNNESLRKKYLYVKFDSKLFRFHAYFYATFNRLFLSSAFICVRVMILKLYSHLFVNIIRFTPNIPQSIEILSSIAFRVKVDSYYMGQKLKEGTQQRTFIIIAAIARLIRIIGMLVVNFQFALTKFSINTHFDY